MTDRPRIYFVRGGAYIRANELLNSRVGQRQMEAARKLREFLQKPDENMINDISQSINKDHEHQRKQLWCGVYIAYVSSANSTKSESAGYWADTALAKFDERFPNPADKYPSSSP